LGSCVGLGNTIGPFLAAAFVEKSTWRGLFWLICPLAVVAGILVAVVLPPSKVHGDFKTKVKSIDYYGTISSSTAILLLLIPISGGGTYFEWSSPMVISMLTLGSITMLVFIIVEWKFAVMPMMPLHLYRNPAVCAIMVQNFLFGIVYYSHLYYLPVYYQNVRQYSPLLSAALTIPFVAGQSTLSILSGQYVSRAGRYGEVIWAGYALWTLGAGLVLLFSRTTPHWEMVIILYLEGAGVGNVFQPTLVAAQAHSTKQDRAVVISVRNFLRALGGSLGLALSSVIFSNVLTKSLASLSTPLPDGYISEILASILKVPDLNILDPVQKNEVLDAYMSASKAVFYCWCPLMAVCLGLCLLIKDKGLQRVEENKIIKTEVRGDMENGTAVETVMGSDEEEGGCFQKEGDDRSEAEKESDVEVGGEHVLSCSRGKAERGSMSSEGLEKKSGDIKVGSV
jgi:MFS family permease